jgi:Na+/proline symporter
MTAFIIQTTLGAVLLGLFVTRRTAIASWVSAILLVLGAACLADDAIIPPRDLFHHLDSGLLTAILPIVGTLFALIIGFVVVVVWQFDIAGHRSKQRSLGARPKIASVSPCEPGPGAR